MTVKITTKVQGTETVVEFDTVEEATKFMLITEDGESNMEYDKIEEEHEEEYDDPETLSVGDKFTVEGFDGGLFDFTPGKVYEVTADGEVEDDRGVALWSANFGCLRGVKITEKYDSGFHEGDIVLAKETILDNSGDRFIEGYFGQVIDVRKDVGIIIVKWNVREPSVYVNFNESDKLQIVSKSID
ncbi:hypothetical protein [Staphylococcus felis]|uniref:YopX protein domain-containing protein n=1 Tax=Staphylococcus felis TaxID=46127 RepID=A0ABS0QLJ7_9STAP|nr:hypothetical protein [Staphylococcus felis]MBH9580088.1 hypothetical protein [Staphylococcus felis]